MFVRDTCQNGGMNTLSEEETRALREALDDEYHAWATYDQVIADFGEVRPFTNIRNAEARHIGALLVLFDRYGLDVPPNTWPGRVPRFRTLEEACEGGVADEIANAEMYDRLLASTERHDILTVLSHLQEASQLRHLSAFQRCVERSGGRGRGRGRGGQRGAAGNGGGGRGGFGGGRGGW